MNALEIRRLAEQYETPQKQMAKKLKPIADRGIYNAASKGKFQYNIVLNVGLEMLEEIAKLYREEGFTTSYWYNEEQKIVLCIHW